MKKLWFFFIILFLSLRAYPQDSLGNISELQRLLKDRKERFEQYAISADQRSGIFGTKTKKDLEQSREILLQIVTTDNNIFNALNQAIVRRGMAKADYSYDEIQNKETIDRLTQAADTLNKQLITQKQINDSWEKKATTQRGFTFMLIGVCIALSILHLFRARKNLNVKHREHAESEIVNH